MTTLHTLSHNTSPETVRASVREANARLEQAGREERGRDRSDPLDRMIAIQMSAYPDSWTDDDKRETAEIHLFGRKSND